MCYHRISHITPAVAPRCPGHFSCLRFYITAAVSVGVPGQCRLCCDLPLSFLPTPGSNMRARRGRVTGATSTKRTSAAKRRRKPARTVPRRERSRTPRSDPQPSGGTSPLNQRGTGDVLGWGFILYSMFPKGRGRLWASRAAAAAGESCSSTLFFLFCFFDTKQNPAVPVYRALSYSLPSLGRTVVYQILWFLMEDGFS